MAMVTPQMITAQTVTRKNADERIMGSPELIRARSLTTGARPRPASAAPREPVERQRDVRDAFGGPWGPGGVSRGRN